MHTPTSQDAALEQAAPNGPFALIVNPQAVFDAIQRSEPLQGLHRRVYRPLGHPPAAVREAANTGFDAGVDDEPEDFEHASALTTQGLPGSRFPK